MITLTIRQLEAALSYRNGYRDIPIQIAVIEHKGSAADPKLAHVNAIAFHSDILHIVVAETVC